ncbi:MAG: helix-turn-helix transcriptional regulator [Chloroflexi bacterium]|nr:helix-turn-helix transcriptional regulator [Chloroflexota bacterium]
MEGRKWWVVMGYPEFDEGPDGFPRPGQVTKHYRYLKKKDNGTPWTQADLAYVLGVSEQEVRNMENRDRGFSLERRRFLANLFSISPIIYGVVTRELAEQWLEQQQSIIQRATIRTPKKITVDITCSREALYQYQESNYAQGGQTLIQDVSRWITLLSQELPDVSDEKQKIERYELLIGYHCLMATILRDLQHIDQAIPSANKAVELAEYIPHNLCYAIALCRRGKIWLDQANVLDDSLAIHAALQAAAHDFQLAYALKEKLPQSVLSPILLNGGHTQARLANGNKQRTQQALNMMDQAITMARNNKAEAPFNVNGIFKIEVERCHLDKGDVLIALGRPKDAIDELSLIADSPNKRRNAYRDVYLAQAYLQKGDLDHAARLAISALPLIKEIHAVICLARIPAIYKQLQKSPFKNNPEVARLDYLLRPH